MKRLLIAIVSFLAFLAFFVISANAVTLLSVPQGGTGIGSVTSGSYLKGAGTGALVPRSVSEVKTDLSLNNVENTTISTWTGTTNITTLGTIGTGTWNGTAIADGYISSASNWNTAYGWGDHSTEGYLTGNETITLSGDISGSGATAITTTIGADKIHDSMIDWGIGANQVSSADMPDHNSHTVRDTFVDIINRGKSEEITITLTGGLGVSWTTGELYDGNTNTFFSTEAGSGNVTDNAVNYLKWVSGTTLTLSTTGTSGDEILIATGSVYDGNINCYRETSLMNETVGNTRRGLRALFPTRVISGMSVHEDTDVTNPLDVTMDAGVFYKDAIEKFTPVEIKSRTTAMVRNFHTGGVWDSDTNAQIETTNYDNGTDLTAIPGSKYVKGLFIYMCDNIGFVYPTEYFNTIAQAQDAALPTMPPGLELVPKLTAIVYQQGAANFTGAIWQDVRAGISEESFSGVTDHGALAGLGDDDHTIYLLADGSRALSGAWDLGGQNLTNGGTITASFTGDLTGNASTSTALAANGGNCSAGEYPLGVDDSGEVESCTDATTEINSVVNGLGGTNLTCAAQSCNVDDFWWNALTDMTLTDTYIYVGNGSNNPVGVSMSSDCTISNTGAITCDHDALDNFVANEHLDWTADLGATNIHSGNYTDNNTTYVSSDFTHNDLTGFVANEHLDWTSDLGATNIHSGNYTAGLTDLTDFDQTAWRLFYSNNLGDVIELSLGTDGQYLKSQGGTSSLTWGTPTNTTYTGGTGITLTGTVFSTTDSEIVHDNLSGFVGDEHLDWTGDLGATNIHAGNYTDTNTTYTAGRSLTLDGTTINADAETYTGKHKIAFETPTATDDFFFGEVATTQTFTSIYCKTLVGTVNLDITIAGTDINGADIVCNTTGVLDSSLGGDTAGGVGEEIALAITSVASDPTYLMVQLNYTYND